jgi:hypothetical protein
MGYKVSGAGKAGAPVRLPGASDSARVLASASSIPLLMVAASKGITSRLPGLKFRSAAGSTTA